jgi:zinc transport system substrate-binding protein
MTMRSNSSVCATGAYNHHSMNKNYLIGIIVLVVIAAGGIYAYQRAHTSGAPVSGKLSVATSFYPLYFFTKAIGGDKVEVLNITPSGAEPHDYDPSTQDIAKIERSKLLVLNGSVEAWGDKIKSLLQGTNVTVVTAGEGLLNKSLTENGQTMADPHVWLDPVLAKQEAHAIEQGLVSADPVNAAYYAQNEQALDAKLDQLDQTYKQGLARCSQKDIVTSHAAFAYLGSRYGLNQVPIAGLSPDAEPSAKQLADVANFAKTHGVKYIFFESLVSPKLSNTIAQEVGAKTLVLDPIEGVSDADQAAGQDYFTIMSANLKNLQTALGCSA